MIMYCLTKLVTLFILEMVTKLGSTRILYLNGDMMSSFSFFL